MPTVRTAARALVLREGQLLVACYRDEQGEWFALPGGGQQHGEDLTTALAREFLEETGRLVRVGRLRFVREVIAPRYSSTNLPADFHQVEHVFACELGDGPLQDASAPDPNQTDCRWMSIEELRKSRFFPLALLDYLGREDVVYLGAAL
jgi:8-oxo-dGTP diphosphatase